MNLIWEQIDDYHKRAKVPGGWLVKTFEDVEHISASGHYSSGRTWRVTMCFVPDPNHEWNDRSQEEANDPI